MPELPEVEVAKRQLEKKIRQFLPVSVHSRVGARLRKQASLTAIVDKNFTKIFRRGKYIVLVFEDQALIVHFGMTGMLHFLQKGEAIYDKHQIVEILDSYGRRLIYTDTRRFGMLDICETANLDSYFKKIGPEPLGEDFLNANLMQWVKRHPERLLKDALLDQSFIAGIGNIYASEICYDLELLPTTRLGDLFEKEIESLKKSVQQILRKAVDYGGSTIRSYVTPDGTMGNAQSLHKVYGREGKECECGNTIQKIDIKGRSTFYCDACQY